MKRKLYYNDQWHDSIADAARATGRTASAMYKRVSMEYTSDKDGVRYTRRMEHRQAILDFIQAYHRAHRVAPTFAEVALDVFNTDNPGAVNAHLRALRAGGFVTWADGRPRTIRVLKATYKEKES